VGDPAALRRKAREVTLKSISVFSLAAIDLVKATKVPLSFSQRLSGLFFEGRVGYRGDQFRRAIARSLNSSATRQRSSSSRPAFASRPFSDARSRSSRNSSIRARMAAKSSAA